MKNAMLVVGILVLGIIGCGDGGSGSPTGPSPIVVTPAASVSVAGAGAIQVHPSARAGWTISLLLPMTFNETAGGTARINYARYSARLRGVEIERAEIGSDQFSTYTLGPNKSTNIAMLFRVNVLGFDDIVITVGLTDQRDGRQFEIVCPFQSFGSAVPNLVPLMR